MIGEVLACSDDHGAITVDVCCNRDWMTEQPRETIDKFGADGVERRRVAWYTTDVSRGR